MRSAARAILVLAGLAVVFSGLWLLAGPLPASWRSPLALALGTALVIFRGSWRSSPASPQMILAVLSVGCFLLNPLFLSTLLFSPDAAALRDTLLAVTFCSLLFWMNHWSVFMRSVLLAFLYGLAVWLGSAVVFWIPVALAPWALFNRRPLPAVGSLFLIVAGGLGLYAVSWGILDLVLRAYSAGPGPFLGAMRQEYGRWAFAVQSSGMPQKILAGDFWPAWAHAASLFALPLALFVLLVTADRLFPSFRSRRADALSFQILLFWTVAFFWFFNLGAGAPTREAGLIPCAALAASLLVHYVDARNFILSRGVQRILVVSGLIGVPAGIALRPWLGLILSLAGLLAALAISFKIVKSQRMNNRLRASAVLVGSYAGVCLGFWVQFFRR